MTRDELRALVQLLPPRLGQSVTARSYQIAQAVLRKFLGFEWVQMYIWTATTGFIRHDVSTPAARETYYMRTIILAEMLYNLQMVEGFDNCLIELEAGQIESAYAALEIGRMLAALASDTVAKFRFVKPQRRRSYDLSITLPDGLTVCGETKCKLEETEITLTTVRRSLQKAQNQLPKRRPGFIFVKIPRHWLDDEAFVADLRQLATRFFRSTKRVVSVKYYTARVTYERHLLGETIGEVIAYREHSNPGHRFRRHRDRNWNLFPEDPPSAPPATMSYNRVRI